MRGSNGDNSITQDEIDCGFPKVAETMADALGCDVEDIKPNVSLIEASTRIDRLPRHGVPARARVQDQDSARQDRRERARRRCRGEFEQKASSPTGHGAAKAYLSEVPPSGSRRR
jgi:hypothetical protein